MMRYAVIIGILLQTVLQSCFAQDSIPKTSTDSGSYIDWTDEDTRKVNRIYDDRDECYAHFVNAWKLKKRWEALYYNLEGKNRQLENLKEQYRLDEADYEEFISLSAEELNTLNTKLTKAEKKVQRRNTIIYILSGAVVAETIALVAIISLR